MHTQTQPVVLATFLSPSLYHIITAHFYRISSHPFLVFSSHPLLLPSSYFPLILTLFFSSSLPFSSLLFSSLLFSSLTFSSLPLFSSSLLFLSQAGKGAGWRAPPVKKEQDKKDQTKALTQTQLDSAKRLSQGNSILHPLIVTDAIIDHTISYFTFSN